jgi:UDP-N-acetylmuramate--alanine ligase
VGLVTPGEAVQLSQLGRVHFAAIGGAGMSGIARVMLARGLAVSGCDTADSAQLSELSQLSAEVTLGHSAEHVRDVDTLVVSTAIRPGNPELTEARRLGVRVLHRAAALAALMAGHTQLAVAGTHGKTTTTSMIVTVLRHCQADPSFVIGGVLADLGIGAAAGRGEHFVAEADESDGSFLMMSPDAAVVTGIEADHLDNYSSLEQIEAAFAAFAGRITAGGMLIACSDDPGALRLTAALAARPVRVITYGTAPGADYLLTGMRPAGLSIELELAAGPRARAAGQPARRVQLAVPGRHNALNAAAAYAMACELGFAPADAAAGLAGFRGARRRLEPKGDGDGVLVLDSYAHHPTELTADLRAARDIAAGGRVLALFQPHLFSRTRIFAAGFGTALGLADEVVVLDVYPAREDPEPGVTGQLVADNVPGGRAVFRPARPEAAALVAELAKPGDVVLTMGAGDVTALGGVILAALRARAGRDG